MPGPWLSGQDQPRSAKHTSRMAVTRLKSFQQFPLQKRTQSALVVPSNLAKMISAVSSRASRLTGSEQLGELMQRAPCASVWWHCPASLLPGTLCRARRIQHVSGRCLEMCFKSGFSLWSFIPKHAYGIGSPWLSPPILQFPAS